ncbi:hypothetical protein JYT22_00005, partial [Endomicrobium sp. AH-315-J14]|nr:hypothetical protein [Endomicrobium sp. AH-315-J14]
MIAGSSGWVSLTVLVTAASVLLALMCTVALAVYVRFSSARLERAAMQGRTGWLLLLTVAPMLATTVIMLLSLAPSALAGAGLMSDHCLTSIHDHLHLCMRHLPTFGPGVLAWLLTLVGAGFFATAGCIALRAVTRGHGA